MAWKSRTSKGQPGLLHAPSRSPLGEVAVLSMAPSFMSTMRWMIALIQHGDTKLWDRVVCQCIKLRVVYECLLEA